MKRLALTFLGVAALCGGAFTLSSCAGGYVGVAGPGYYDDGPYVYGGGWWHGGGGWHGGWAHPGFHHY